MHLSPRFPLPQLAKHYKVLFNLCIGRTIYLCVVLMKTQSSTDFRLSCSAWLQWSSRDTEGRATLCVHLTVAPRADEMHSPAVLLASLSLSPCSGNKPT